MLWKNVCFFFPCGLWLFSWAAHFLFPYTEPTYIQTILYVPGLLSRSFPPFRYPVFDSLCNAQCTLQIISETLATPTEKFPCRLAIHINPLAFIKEGL